MAETKKEGEENVLDSTEENHKDSNERDYEEDFRLSPPSDSPSDLATPSFDDPATEEPANKVISKSKESKESSNTITEKISARIKEMKKKEEKRKSDKEDINLGRKDREEEDETIDFSNAKKKFTGFLKGLKANESKKDKSKKEEQKSGEDTTIDFKRATAFSKKNSYWLIPLVLVLIAIIVSTHFRMMPSYLPIADEWAENTVHDFYKNQIRGQVNQQYPNLPEQNRETFIETEFQKMLQDNPAQIDMDIGQLSMQYRENFKDESGDTYLLAIDPYLWYSQARNVLNHGHLGDKIIDGESYFSLRDGRLDKKTSVQLHPYFTAYTYKILNIFNPSISLMRATFLMPVIIIGLALIPAFFIGRRISGNVGGFFAALFLAVNGPLLSRTPAGFSDTDPYNILLPLFIAWLFLEAYKTENTRNRWIFSSLAGLLVGVYAATWSGWSYIFLFVLGATTIMILLNLLLTVLRSKTKIFNKVEKGNLIHQITSLLIFFLSSGIFVTLFDRFEIFWRAFLRPIQFITLKEVGVKNIWPNVITTVAEFNTTSFSHIIGQMGGKLLFSIAVIGAILMLLKMNKNKKIELIYFILFFAWFVGAAYAFTKGARFALLMAPPFAIALGSAFGFAYHKFADWISKSIKLDVKAARILVFIVLALFLISPLSTAQKIAKSEVPSMNDGWYDALTKIKDDSEDAIITSWWDFGHWFQSIAERRVTFDGGDQGRRIHWVGRTLQTDSDAEAIGILRMLNCVQETAPAKLDEFTGDTYESIKILYQIFPISERNQAYLKYQELGLTKEQAVEMLEYTHCKSLIPNYYITSEDMVGKAGVWGHFGSWNFERAVMYQNTKKLSRVEGVSYLMQNFGLSEEEADRIHSEIKTTKGDQWISPWPGYHSNPQKCERVSATELRCVGGTRIGNIPFRINLENFDVSIEGNPNVKPGSIVYATRVGIEEKEFPGQETGFSLILIPEKDTTDYFFMLADSLQAASTFTKLFYFDGHGQKCFSKFDDRRQVTGGRIIIWKADFSCQQENKIFFLPKEEVRASHILISTTGRTEAEARSIIENIKAQATSQNFADLAKEHSDDSSGPNGGDLGWFGRGLTVKEFEETAFSLDEGDISEIIQTQFGFHIIYVQEKRIR